LTAEKVQEYEQLRGLVKSLNRLFLFLIRALFAERSLWDCLKTLMMYRKCLLVAQQIGQISVSTAVFKTNVKFNDCSARLKEVFLQNSDATISD
jgi:hypothetical protein